MIVLNAVVFDLELVKRYRKGQLSEIVEIGACKVDLKLGKITDQFQIYIKPKSGYVAKSTRKFINMTKEDLKQAVTFKEGVERFSQWLGEGYYLCSWGRDDRLHFINECLRNRMRLDWLINYNDIQQQIGKMLGITKNQVGLKTALDLAGIEPQGIAHRGIDDAINTAELLIKYLSEVKLQKNSLTSKEIAQHKRAQRLRQQENRSHSKNPPERGRMKPKDSA